MPRKILIVDDQEDILLVLMREFRRMPEVSAISTNKFAEALSLVEEKDIDLVICDVRLGRESGFDLIREINHSHPGIGSILMSAYRSSSNRQQAADLGVILFLEKPFQISRLIAEVESFFQQRENPAPPVAAPISALESPEESTGLIHFKLQELVQLFCHNGRNVVITVRSDTQKTGEIYIQRGRVIHADFDQETGDSAFHALMQLPNPLLKVKDWTAPVPVTIVSSWEYLLLQSAIHLDHRANMDLPLNPGLQAQDG